jgi:tryptophan 2,3-dioxygenase
MSKSVTYGDYLGLDRLLALQQPRPDLEHDELLFIVVHQVYELWFKEILHEIDYVKGLLEKGDAHRSQHTLKRILTILKVMVGQLDILETMTPLEFLSFRERLEAASGFQSHQFRALEFELGRKSRATVERFPEASPPRVLLGERYDAPTLWDAFLQYLALAGYDVPLEQLSRDVTQPITPSPDIQRVLVQVYKTDPKSSELCERMVDLDEGVQEWRYRHVKMVERTIGAKPGTGGSAGAEYLRTTLGQPAFPDLWEVRRQL